MRQLIALSAGERLGSRGLVTRRSDQLVFEFLEVRIKLGQTIVIRGFTSFDNRLALELNRLSGEIRATAKSARAFRDTTCEARPDQPPGGP